MSLDSHRQQAARNQMFRTNPLSNESLVEKHGERQGRVQQSSVRLSSARLSWGTVRLWRACLVVVCFSVLIANGFANEMQALISGRSVGEHVPQFYVRAVTGPLMNKSVCYVCRNGDRPVAMIFLRDVVPGTADLLKQLDQFVDQNRAVGLRGFGVLLSENQRVATSKLQTLAFDNQLSLPLTMAHPQVESAENQNLHPHAAVTVVLYHDHTVTASYAFRETEITRERIAQVMTGVRDLIAKARAE